MALEPDFVSKVTEVLYHVMIGATGGIVALILKNKRHPVSAYVGAVIVSGFVGFLVFNLAKASDFNDYLTTVAVGIGGVFGPVTLNGIARFIYGRLGLEASVPEITPCDLSVPQAAKQKKEDDSAKS